MQPVDIRIRVAPGVYEPLGVERADVHLSDEPRTGRHEQTNRQLDRRHRLHEITLLEEPEELEIALAAHPRMEGDERGLHDEPRLAAEIESALEFGARVALVETREHVVVEGLRRAG